MGVFTSRFKQFHDTYRPIFPFLKQTEGRKKKKDVMIKYFNYNNEDDLVTMYSGTNEQKIGTLTNKRF